MPAFVRIERRSFGFFWLESWIPDRLEIVGETLKITVGNNLTEVYIPDIVDIRAIYKNDSNSLKISKLTINFEQIILTTHQKEFILKTKFFRKANFKKFTEILAEVWSESLQGFEDKMTTLRKKCTASIQQDKKLEDEFRKKLIQICESVYQPFHIQVNNQEIKKISTNPDTIFYHQIDSRFYRYYRQSAPKPNADPKNVATAHNMILTVLANLQTTSERIISYEKVLENLTKKRHQQRNRQKLSGLIDDLEQLQMQNSTRTFHEQMTNYEGDILNELDDVFDEHSDISEKSEILKNYASIFEETLENNVDLSENGELSVEQALNLPNPPKQILGIRLVYQKDKQNFEASFSHSEKLILGRRAVGEIILNPISQISREHCELVRENNQVKIRDLNSTNGTYFGRIKTDCRTPQILKNDSIIYLGREEFKVYFIY